MAQRTKSKEPGMGEIKNALFAVIKLAKQMHQAWNDKSDVARGNNQFDIPVKSTGLVQFLGKGLRIFQMLNHVKEEDIILADQVDGKIALVQIALLKLFKGQRVGGRIGVYTIYSATFLFQGPTHIA